MRMLFVLSLLLVTIGSPGWSQEVSESPPAFALRVNPKWTDEVNEVLSRIARPVAVVVPAGQTPEEYLSRFCGGPVPAFEKLETLDTGATKVLMTPCARVRRNVEIAATAGDTLEGLAVRNGLPRTVATSLKVIPSGEVRARVITPESLQIGDKVILPEVPLWSHVVVDPEVAEDRAAVVSALASRLGCDDGEQEECLAKRDVSVLNRASARAKEDVPVLQPFERRLSRVISQDSVEAQRRIESALEAAALILDPSNYPPPLPPPASTSVAAGSVAQPLSIPVAQEQWPYDAKLLAAILEKAVDAEQIRVPTTIGVADGGLGNAMGSPLPGSVFDIGLEKRSDDQGLEPDGDDNDFNLYVDDFFGAGVPRLQEGELMGTGDLGLCKDGPLPFSTWRTESLAHASHGAVVSSVAAALGLRQAAPHAVGALPKMVFFRMLENACTEDADFRPAEAELITAFSYLASRAHVINISAIEDLGEAGGSRFKAELRDVLPHHEVLFVVPAGNDSPGDLDEAGNCPPCMGNDSADRGGTAAKRTLVVGAATRDLRRASFSNYGKGTVGLFAPGEPTGALNLAEQQVPASASDAATSYAAPLAALAAAIVRSFGGDNSPMDVRDRLMASTWPLDDPESRPDRTHVGVLDLVKAAAVRLHAVEVKEIEPDGQLVRRTYVGKLLTPLKTLNLCAGQAFQEAGVHAIRLGEPGGDGDRRLLIYYRKLIDKRTNRRLIKSVSCRPVGDLRLETLTDGEKTFPLSEVTHIQLPWLLGS